MKYLHESDSGPRFGRGLFLPGPSFSSSSELSDELESSSSSSSELSDELESSSHNGR